MPLIPDKTKKGVFINPDTGDFTDELGTPLTPEQYKKSPSGEPTSLWEKVKQKASDVGDLYGASEIANAEAMMGTGEAAKQIGKEYGPAIVGAGATAMLGPEVGWPAYAALGGLSQGATKAVINKAEGKPAFNMETGKEALLGTLGGAVQKPLSAIGSAIAKKLAIKFGGDKAAQELAEGIIRESLGTQEEKLAASTLGPEVKGTLENILEHYSEGAAPNLKLADQIAGLLNKSPKQLRGISLGEPNLSQLQTDVGNMLSSLRPAGKAGAAGVGIPSNLLTQQLGNIGLDKIQNLIDSLGKGR